MDLERIAGIAHRPPGSPAGVVVLTHGAGGDRDSPLLIGICHEWASNGWIALRYNLPYRRRRAQGPPSGSAAADRDGIVEALLLARGLVDVPNLPVLAGGHSYGGRQTSMVVAENPELASSLTLFSYPLHPPGKPENLRTEHFPSITVPTVFTHGTADPFGSIGELRSAVGSIPAPTTVIEVTGARHDLGSKTLDVPALAVAAAIAQFRV